MKTLKRLVNGVAPFNMSTELASGVAPLANGENGGRRGTAVRRSILQSWMSRIAYFVQIITANNSHLIRELVTVPNHSEVR